MNTFITNFNKSSLISLKIIGGVNIQPSNTIQLNLSNTKELSIVYPSTPKGYEDITVIEYKQPESNRIEFYALNRQPIPQSITSLFKSTGFDEPYSNDPQRDYPSSVIQTVYFIKTV